MQLEKIKGEIKTVEELGEMASVLEQVAAKEISKIKQRIIAGRPFFQESWRIYHTMHQIAPIPPQVVKKNLVVIITLNWGMFGNLLNKVIDRGEQLYQQHSADILITGKLGQARFANKDERTAHFFQLPNHADYEAIEPIKKIVAQYAQIHLVFPQYVKASKQEVQAVSLIVGQTESDKTARSTPTADEIQLKQFTLEPGIQPVVNYLNQTIVGVLLYNYFQEALLAYNASQMVAMRSAHDSAKEEQQKLVAQYHKARREQIDAKLRELQESKYAKSKNSDQDIPSY